MGRGDNAPGSVFVRASQPIIIGNKFIDSDLGSDDDRRQFAQSRRKFTITVAAPDLIEDIGIVGNSGPLIEDNSLTNNAINGLVVRGGQLATEGVWDDVNIVHVVTESIEIPNQHIFGGLRSAERCPRQSGRQI